MSPATLQDHPSVDSLFNVVETETLAQVYFALCLRLVIAITNYERGDNPGSTVITV